MEVRIMYWIMIRQQVSLSARLTWQGAFDESAWSRGQSWGFYGFTMMYRFTKDKRYLEQAKKIAGFIFNHPNMPSDLVPYWDFNARDIPNAYRDASAAAINASALLELAQYVNKKEGNAYIIKAEKNYPVPFIGKSTGQKPGGKWRVSPYALCWQFAF
jgi:rhamnogalacturonyl hydrolase YesR